MAIETLSRGIVNKILHTPIRSLKSAAAGPEITTLMDSFRKLFDLHTRPPVLPDARAVGAEDDESEQGS